MLEALVDLTRSVMLPDPQYSITNQSWSCFPHKPNPLRLCCFPNALRDD